jgi:hypothetical protein
VCGSRELTHVQSDLGDDHLGGLDADAGDLVQAIDRRQPARRRRLVGVLAGVASLIRGWLGGGDGADQLVGCVYCDGPVSCGFACCSGIVRMP